MALYFLSLNTTANRVISRRTVEFFWNFIRQIFAFVIMSTFETVADFAGELMFALEDSMRNRHMQMGSSIEDNRLFGGHSNPEQRSRPRMPLSSVEERLPRADRKRIGCANDTMSGLMSERADDERQ